MKTTRKRYGADLKARVALEAIRGDLTLAKLAAKHGIHHTKIAAWERQAIDGIQTHIRDMILLDCGSFEVAINCDPVNSCVFVYSRGTDIITAPKN